jgi:DNA-binding Lrp family transcriptional regulator
MQELTTVQFKILSGLPKEGGVLLRELSGSLGMSSNHVREQVRRLESSGHLSVSRDKGRTAPLKIKLIALLDNALPDFDKLLFSTKWV